jgi:hypothetical protein
MGFSVGVLLGVVLAGYALQGFSHPNPHRLNTSLTCPWLQEIRPPEQQQITVADRVPAQATRPATRSAPR